MNMFGGAPVNCPRCSKRVYFAEQVIALGHHWHKSCFCCANVDCHRRLDARSLADHDGEAYCVNCHRRLFGPKGYGATLGMQTAVNSEINQKAIDSMPSAYSRSMVAPLTDRGNVGGNGVSVEGEEEVKAAPISPNTSVGSLDLEVLQRVKTWNLDDKNLCRRCGKTVYFAEKQLAAGATWHRQGCFTCALCNRALQPGQLCEKDNEVLCKNCYGRAFGPKGYGFGMGAGTLQMGE